MDNSKASLSPGGQGGRGGEAPFGYFDAKASNNSFNAAAGEWKSSALLAANSNVDRRSSSSERRRRPEMEMFQENVIQTLVYILIFIFTFRFNLHFNI